MFFCRDFLLSLWIHSISRNSNVYMYSYDSGCRSAILLSGSGESNENEGSSLVPTSLVGHFKNFSVIGRNREKMQ